MKKLLASLCILALVISCGRFDKKEFDATKDVRIVSVSKHLTEMIFALGKGGDIVGCDLTSSYPDSSKQIPKVGYHRMLNAEGIISLRPDVVVHSNDIGPANVIPQLENVGMRLKAFGSAGTYDSAQLLIKDLGAYFGVQAKADSIVNKMTADLKTVETERANYEDTPSVMIIHFGQANNVYFVMSGRKGAGDRMINMAGGKAAAYDAKGARQISAEAVAVANPDVIIATDYGFDKMGSAEKFKTIPGVALTNAAKNNRIYRFEEHDLVYFGPRSAENIIKLMKLIHPDVSKK